MAKRKKPVAAGMLCSLEVRRYPVPPDDRCVNLALMSGARTLLSMSVSRSEVERLRGVRAGSCMVKIAVAYSELIEEIERVMPKTASAKRKKRKRQS